MEHLTHAPAFGASHKHARLGVLCVALALAGVLGYSLFTAQRASGATLAKKVYAVVDGTTGSLIRGSHAVSASRLFSGRYFVNFDRHVDNCALVASMGSDGTTSIDVGPVADKIVYAVADSGVGSSTKSVLVNTFNLDSGGTPGNEQFADSDFHIIGLCPGT